MPAQRDGSPLPYLNARKFNGVFFIVMEGLDLSGKTTVGRFIIEELEQREILSKYNSAKQRWLRNLSKKIRKYRYLPSIVPELLFILAVLYDTVKIAWWLKSGISVIQDRYYFSYKWYPSTRGNSGISTLPLIKVLRGFFLRPDVTFLCCSNTDKLRERYETVFKSQDETLSENDQILYSGSCRNVLENHQQYFENEFKNFPNGVIIENNGSLYELRNRVKIEISSLLKNREQAGRIGKG